MSHFFVVAIVVKERSSFFPTGEKDRKGIKGSLKCHNQLLKLNANFQQPISQFSNFVSCAATVTLSRWFHVMSTPPVIRSSHRSFRSRLKHLCLVWGFHVGQVSRVLATRVTLACRLLNFQKGRVTAPVTAALWDTHFTLWFFLFFFPFFWWWWWGGVGNEDR